MKLAALKAQVAQDVVAGERGTPSVFRGRSLQSRASSAVAAGLMLLLGICVLVWYYTSIATRQARARQSAQTATATRVQGELPLPALGHFDTSASPAAAPLPPSLVEVPRLSLEPTDLHGAVGAAGGESGTSGAGPVSPVPPPEIVRQLSGAAFARDSGGTATVAHALKAYEEAGVPTSNEAQSTNDVPPDGRLGSLLRARPSVVVAAQVMPTQRFLLPKGAFIDCTLETAIDSTLPGMTTCITAIDTFSADGKVVLLERGTKLVGETRGGVQQGAARVFVLWTEARSPAGIVVPLASPGTDELGRSGFSGAVNRHFLDRFGAAMLISVINGAVQSAVQSSRGNGTLVYSPTSTQDVLTEVLKSTVNIAPTVVKQHGDRIQILVARDLDFRSVYELRSAGPRP